MPKKLLIHFLLLLLMMTFAQVSFSEASENLEESNKEVADEQNEEEKEYLQDKVKDFESSEGEEELGLFSPEEIVTRN